MRRSQSYPDRSAIFAQKAAGRRRRAALTFAEKLVLLEALKERSEPIVRARLGRGRRHYHGESPRT